MSFFDVGTASQEGRKLRLKLDHAPGEVRDAPSVGITLAVRFVRAMVLWIVVFFVDRAYQESYVQRVLIDSAPAPGPGELADAPAPVPTAVAPQSPKTSPGKVADAPPDTLPAGRPPPKLWTLPAAVLALEAMIMGLLSTVLLMLYARFKSDDNAFVIDRAFLRRVAADYAKTSLLILLLGTAFAKVAQDDRLFRYRDDGIRGIRAFSTMFLLVSLAILFQPFV